MYSFDSTRRLIKKNDFDNVFSKAKKIVFGHVTVLYKPNALPSARLGFAISKRFISKAVLRNKIRRVFKESFRQQTHLPAYDIVVLLNQPCNKQKIEHFQINIKDLWQKLNN